MVREYYEEELGTFAVERVLLSDATGRPVGLVDTADDGAPGGPSVLAIGAQAAPNPLRETSKVAYALPSAGQVQVAVFDAAGRRVRLLADGWQGAGPHSVNWDGRDEVGNRVADGVYFALVRTEAGEEVAKITVVR